MMIKINARESVEIVENVFVNLINEDGSQYHSWDEMSETQQQCFSGLAREFRTAYEKYKSCMA